MINKRLAIPPQERKLKDLQIIECFMRRIPYFQQAAEKAWCESPESLLRKFAKYLTRLSYRSRGQALFVTGQRETGVFIVLRGACSLFCEIAEDAPTQPSVYFKPGKKLSRQQLLLQILTQGAAVPAARAAANTLPKGLNTPPSIIQLQVSGQVSRKNAQAENVALEAANQLQKLPYNNNNLDLIGNNRNFQMDNCLQQSSSDDASSSYMQQLPYEQMIENQELLSFMFDRRGYFRYQFVRRYGEFELIADFKQGESAKKPAFAKNKFSSGGIRTGTVLTAEEHTEVLHLSHVHYLAVRAEIQAMKLKYFLQKFTHSIFRSLPPERLMLLLKRAKKIKCQPSEIIYSENQMLEGIYLIARGVVQLVKNVVAPPEDSLKALANNLSTDREGKSEQYQYLQDGFTAVQDAFGQTKLLQNEISNAWKDQCLQEVIALQEGDILGETEFLSTQKTLFGAVAGTDVVLYFLNKNLVEQITQDEGALFQIELYAQNKERQITRNLQKVLISEQIAAHSQKNQKKTPLLQRDKKMSEINSFLSASFSEQLLNRHSAAFSHSDLCSDRVNPLDISQNDQFSMTKAKRNDHSMALQNGTDETNQQQQFFKENQKKQRYIRSITDKKNASNRQFPNTNFACAKPDSKKKDQFENKPVQGQRYTSQRLSPQPKRYAIDYYCQDSGQQSQTRRSATILRQKEILGVKNKKKSSNSSSKNNNNSGTQLPQSSGLVAASQFSARLARDKVYIYQQEPTLLINYAPVDVGMDVQVSERQKGEPKSLKRLFEHLRLPRVAAHTPGSEDLRSSLAEAGASARSPSADSQQPILANSQEEANTPKKSRALIRSVMEENLNSLKLFAGGGYRKGDPVRIRELKAGFSQRLIQKFFQKAIRVEKNQFVID